MPTLHQCAEGLQKSHQMGDAERDLGTVQEGQGRALWPSPLPLPSTGLTLALL
jgi:hypothetical protein